MADFMNKKHYIGLYENTPVCYQSLNSKGEIIDVNGKWLKTFGYSRDSILGTRFSELLQEEFAAGFDSIFKIYMSRGYSDDAFYSIRKADGKYLSVTINAYASYDDSGNFLQDHAFLTPVEQERPTYSQIFKSTTAPMIVYDVETMEIVDVNGAACSFYGYSYEKITSMKLADISNNSEKKIKRNIREVLKADGDKSFIFDHKTAGGRVRTVEVRPTPLSSSGKKYVCSIISDVTEKVKSDRRAESMAVLSAKLLSPDLEVKDVVEAIKNFSKSLTGAEYCYVSIFDDDRGLLEVKGVSGRNHIVRRNEGKWDDIFNNCLNSLNFLVENNLPAGRSARKIPDWHRGERNLMFCPVYLEKELVGHISLADSPAGFSICDTETIDEIAKLYALAVKGLRERRIEAIFQSLFDNMADGVAIYYSDGKGDFIFKSLNKAGLAISGYKAEDVLGRSLTDVYPGFQDSDLIRVFREVWDTGQPQVLPVTKYEDDAHSLWVENYVFKISDRYIVAIYRDVSDLLKANKALEESEARYRSYVENSPDPIIVINRSLDIIDVNSAAVEKFEYSVEELKARKIYNLWPDDIQLQFIKNIGASKTRVKEGFKVIHEHVSKTGKKYNMHVHVKILPSGMMVGVLQDMTERIKMECELSELNSNLQKKVEEEIAIREKQERMLFEQKKLADMGQMINAIAHQWRQPINVLGLYTQSIYDSFIGGSLTKQDMESFMSDTLSMILHMSKTIDDFRDFFKPDKEKVSFSVVQEIINLLNLIDAQLAVRNVDVNVVCSAGGKKEKVELGKKYQCFLGDADIEGYPGEFKQAVINIINNAVDSIQERMEQDEGERGEIYILVETLNKDIKIRISDNGTGIPKDIISKIYDPYFSTKGEGKGTGIGLYMTKLVIEKHMGGAIKAGNTRTGAFMELRFPRKS